MKTLRSPRSAKRSHAKSWMAGLCWLSISAALGGCVAGELSEPEQGQEPEAETLSLELTSIPPELEGRLPLEEPETDAETDIAAARVAAPIELVLQPGPEEGIDTRVFSLPAGAAVNYGTYRGMEAAAWTWSGVPAQIRGFIDFDLSSVPSTQLVNKATLVLSADVTPGVAAGHSTLSGPNDGLLVPVTSSWSETELTWNNQPDVDMARAIPLPASTAADQTYEIDVTSYVQSKLKSPTEHHGFMLRLADEQYYRSLQFASSDNADPLLRPKLVIQTQSGVAAKVGTCTVDFGASHSALTASFSAYPSGKAPFDLSWDFGDGQTGTSDPITHTYAYEDNHLVCLTMVDAEGCVAKTCHPVSTMNVSGGCCEGNESIQKWVQYEPNRWAKLEFSTNNAGVVGTHNIRAMLTTYSAKDQYSRLQREAVDNLHIDIMGTIYDRESAHQCGTVSTPVDKPDNEPNASRLRVKIPIGRAFAVHNGDLSAFFKVRRGNFVYTEELKLSECTKKGDGEGCSGDDQCQSGQCGGCLNAVGWCFSPSSSEYGESCRSDLECSTGRCSADCYFNSKGSCLCDGDSDCGAGNYCAKGEGKCHGKLGNHDRCHRDGECQSGACGGLLGGGWCYEPGSVSIGGQCLANGECSTNRCVDLTGRCGCTNDAQCGSGRYCGWGTNAGECRDKKGKGALCVKGDECKSGKCRFAMCTKP